MKFKMEIELGNDEMRTIAHLTRAVKKTAEKMSTYAKPLVGEGGGILDVNGNIVGRWEIVG